MGKEKPIAITANRKNGTIYIVEHQTSDCAKETALDKIKRLILSTTENSTNYKAS